LVEAVDLPGAQTVAKSHKNHKKKNKVTLAIDSKQKEINELPDKEFERTILKGI
jgi:hypothetical protein